MKAEQAKEWCCVIAALAAITGDDPNKILAAIAAQAEPGECTLDNNGMMNRRTYSRWLDAQGWKGTWRQDQPDKKFSQPIPLTCLVIYEGHVFAIVDGTIYDTGSSFRWGREIIALYEPPSKK